MPATWTVRGATFVVWALAAGSAAYWGLKVGGRESTVPAPLPPARQMAAADPAAIARLLGSAPAGPNTVAAPAAPSLASRFQLVGVAAEESSGGGAAIISVDGKPGRPYRVGSAVDEGLVLQSVHGRQAVLGTDRHGPPVLTLEVPALRAANTGGAALMSPVTAPTLPAPGALPVPQAGGMPPQAAAIAAPK